MEHRTGYRRLDGTSSRPGGEAGEADGTGVTGEELGGAKECSRLFKVSMKVTFSVAMAGDG